MSDEHLPVAPATGNLASSEVRSARARTILHTFAVSLAAACFYFVVYRQVFELVVDRLGSLHHSYSSPSSMMSFAAILTLSGGIALLQLSRLRSSFFANAGLIVFWAPSVMAAATLGDVARPTRMLLLVACILFIVVVVLRPLDVSRFVVLQRPLGVSPYLVLVTVPWAASMAYIVYRNGFHVQVPSLTEIYDVRSVFRSASNEDRLFGYVFSWQSNVFAPLLLGVGIIRRNLFMVLASVGSLIYMFTVSGEKTILFTSVFVVGILVVFRNGRLGRRSASPARWVVGAAVALGLSALIDLVLGRVVTLAFAARLLMAQGFNSAYWLDFFSTHQKTHYGNSTLGAFFQYPYDSPPGFVVGEWFGRPNVNVNANLMADGYAAVGLFGVVISAFVFSLTLETIRALSARVDVRIVAITMAGPMFSMFNSSAIQALWGGGGLLAIVLLMVCPSDLSPQPTRRTVRASERR